VHKNNTDTHFTMIAVDMEVFVHSHNTHRFISILHINMCWTQCQNRHSKMR